MKMKSNFDEHVKQLLGDYEPEVPSRVWENIQQRTKRKPRGSWFFFKKYGWAPVLLLLCGYFGWQAYFNNNQQQHSTPSEVNSSAPASHPSSTSPADEGEKIKNVDEAESALSNNNISPKVAANQSALTTSVNNTHSYTKKSASLHSGNLASNVHEETMTPIDNESNYLSSNKNKTTWAARKKMRQQVGEIDNTDKASSIETEVNTEKENLLHDMKLTSPEWLSLAKSLHPSVKGIQRKEITIPCPGGGNPAWNKQYIEVYGGPDYVFRQLHDSASSSEYLNQRKQSTNFYYAYSAGISYTKVWENGLSCKVGLNYSRVTEKFDYTQGNIIQIIYVTDANGDTIGNYQTTSARHKVTFNKYRTIDVPLMFGYETAKGNWTFNFSAGAIVNIHSWTRGELLDRSLQPINITSGDQSNPYQMRSNIGLGATASVSAYYRLNEQLKVFAAPYFRYNFSSMNSSELALQQRFQTMGIRLGLRMELGKK